MDRDRDYDIIIFEPELGMEFKTWLFHFDQKCLKYKLGENWKFEKFQKYLKGSALKVYINQCLMCTSFKQIIEIFQENFFKPTINFTDFQNLIFNGNPKDLYKYFNKKVEMGRKLKLDTQHIMESLSVGLPNYIKNLILIKEPKILTEWLDLVSRLLEKLQTHHSYTDSGQNIIQCSKQPISFHRLPVYQNRWIPNLRERQRQQNNVCQPVTPRFEAENISNQRAHHMGPLSNFPRNPCRYCTQRGIFNAYHWSNTCINNSNVSKPNIPNSKLSNPAK